MDNAAATAAAKKLVRAKDWQEGAYHRFLLERAQRPFAWGSNDCALFAADGIEAMTGVDIAFDFRGRYHDAAGAVAAIGAVTGGTTIADAAEWCAQKHGLPEWRHPLQAQRGDLVVFDAGDGLQAGLIHLTGAHVVLPGETGLRIVRVLAKAKILRSWHV
jgi:hypothetical protein